MVPPSNIFLSVAKGLLPKVYGHRLDATEPIRHRAILVRNAAERAALFEHLLLFDTVQAMSGKKNPAHMISFKESKN
jgi:hypothetical protein